MSSSAKGMRTKPVAVFMAFGTKGDVYPIAAIAAAFASDLKHYEVAFITHSAHEKLKSDFNRRGIAYFPVSSPPTLPSYQDSAGCKNVSFSIQKKEITTKHRQDCVSIVERIFGDNISVNGDLIVINFFALEGWSLAELFHVHCIVAAPYIVPYSAPSSFECQFQKELPLLYKYLQEAPNGSIGWKDVIHWMWPLFTYDWGAWRSHDLQLSIWPFTDPVTGLPAWHERPLSPLMLYGFSKEVVECPDYWPSRVQVCGFWFLPTEWQFSCKSCADISSLISARKLKMEDGLCFIHAKLEAFVGASAELPIFMGLSSVGSMGYLKNPCAFLKVLEKVLSMSTYRFVLFSAGYGPLDAAIEMHAQAQSSISEQLQIVGDQTHLFCGRLFCFSGELPYNWLFPRCSVAIHHGGSGSTAAALRAGIPQVICPFILDQFYWAERMFWIGVAPEPLKSANLLPDKDDDFHITEAANVLVKAINSALSPEVKLRTSQIAKRISVEDGVSKAVQLIKEETNPVSVAI